MGSIDQLIAEIVPSWVVILFVAILGLFIGSFLNVIIARWHRLTTVVRGRSACPDCQRQLSWYDLVPLFSFVCLGGHCRYCKKPISWQYPLVELITALVAAHLVFLYGLSWLSLAYFIIFSLLLAVAVIDLRHGLIPDQLILPAIGLALLVALLGGQPNISLLGWAVLLAGGLLASFVVISNQRWMGAGDIGLGILIGLLGGWPGAITGLMVAFGTATFASLIALATKHKKIKDSIPFGPFLAAGAYVAAHSGANLVTAYLNLINYY